MRFRRVLAGTALAGAAALVVRGDLTLDLGIGRRLQPLGPLTWRIAAPREVVFDVIAAPYLGRTPRALAGKLEVWERSSEMAVAAHRTSVRPLTTTTVEAVRFERPDRIHFRLLRGPVPHVTEAFTLRETDDGTELSWAGELGTDFWALGELWGARVARSWERAVRASLEQIRVEAERRAR